MIPSVDNVPKHIVKMIEEGYTFREVAAKLNMTLSTVHKWYTKELRNQIEHNQVLKSRFLENHEQSDSLPSQQMDMVIDLLEKILEELKKFNG